MNVEQVNEEDLLKGQYDGTELETCYSYWGIECSEGWKHLYQPLIEYCEEHKITVTQIKEKFGGLRFYVDDVPEDRRKELYDMIADAERESYETCEVCGEPGISRSDGWIKTLCEKHHEERKNRRH